MNIYWIIFENEDMINNITKTYKKLSKQVTQNKFSTRLKVVSLIHVIEFNEETLEFYHDMKKDESKCILIWV